MAPISNYGVSKKSAFDIGAVYRKSYGLKITCGVAFNHESPRRGQWFLTQKVTRFIAMVRYGMVRRRLGGMPRGSGDYGERLQLGYKAGIRDWGNAEEYVRIMHAVLQRGLGECVIGTGIGRTVEDFVALTFELHDLDPQEWVDYDFEANLRPTEPEGFVADIATLQKLGLAPKDKIEDVLQEMVSAWEHRLMGSKVTI